jgi:hypothetical protein
MNAQMSNPASVVVEKPSKQLSAFYDDEEDLETEADEIERFLNAAENLRPLLEEYCNCGFHHSR